MIVKNRDYKDIKKSKKKTRLVPYSYTLKETQKRKIKVNKKYKKEKNSNKGSKSNSTGKSRSKSNSRRRSRSKSNSTCKSRNRSRSKQTSMGDNQKGGFFSLFKNLFQDPKVRKFLSYKKAITKYYETKLKKKIEKLQPLQRKFELISNKLTLDNQALFLLVKMKVIYDKRAAEEVRNNNNNNISKKFNILEDKVIINKKKNIRRKNKSF